MINEKHGPNPNSTGKKRKLEITENGYQKLNEFLAQVNCNHAGRVRIPDILEYAVQKLGQSDIENIQETYYSPEDKIDLILHRENQGRDGAPLTKEDLLASMLLSYQRSQIPKTNKTALKK